jgi:BirA family biotin operon repressor/biotin-[acetyl-CoA-carboxylase] ligase
MDETNEHTASSDLTPGATETLDLDALRRALAGLRLGTPLRYCTALGSTNTSALELARSGSAEGALVITDHQTAGRGRAGRAWEPLPGQQLTFSLLLRPPFAPHWLVMASALAVAEAVEAVTGMRPQIKWPNDVLLEGRKVCGILIESGTGYAVLGIGVNVNGTLADHPVLAARAATLAQATGHVISRETLAAEIVQGLDATYAALCEPGELGRAAQRELRAAWRERLDTLGRRVVIHQGGQAEQAEQAGVAEDVTADGALLLRDDAGALRTITWGDVEAITPRPGDENGPRT